MKMTKLAFIISCVLASSTPAQDIPAIVSNGLDAFKTSGGKAALATWLKGSALENDSATNSTIIGILNEIDSAYGKMKGFEKLRVVSITPSFRRVYLLIKFEKGPIFVVFDCYKFNSEWIIPQLDFNTKAGSVLPAGILETPAQ